MITIQTQRAQHQHTAHGGACCQGSRDEVTQAAYALYLKHGSQHGNDVRNWLEAEAEVHAKHDSSRFQNQTVGQGIG